MHKILSLLLVGLAGCTSVTGPSPVEPSGLTAYSPKTPHAAYTAFGNRESWRIVAQETTLLIDFDRNGKPCELHLAATRTNPEDSAVFTGTDGDAVLTLEIRQEPCHAESEDTAFSALFTYDGIAMPGCAVPGATEYADT